MPAFRANAGQNAAGTCPESQVSAATGENHTSIFAANRREGSKRTPQRPASQRSIAISTANLAAARLHAAAAAEASTARNATRKELSEDPKEN